jgi:site-specific recombinase XerD
LCLGASEAFYLPPLVDRPQPTTCVHTFIPARALSIEEEKKRKKSLSLSTAYATLNELSRHGIQKRIEYYATKSGLNVSCHQLRPTMATQLLNADADLATMQDLLGHGQITTTQRYCRVSNLKVQRDYYKAIEVVLARAQARDEDEFALG